MKTGMWIFLVAVVLCLCVSASFFLLMPGSEAASAEIYSQGKFLRSVDLSTDQTFAVDTEKGHNVITVKDGKIAVTEANCPDHYCMARGFCNSGAQIVCLPNELVIQFVSESEIDGFSG